MKKKYKTIIQQDIERGPVAAMFCPLGHRQAVWFKMTLGPDGEILSVFSLN